VKIVVDKFKLSFPSKFSVFLAENLVNKNSIELPDVLSKDFCNLSGQELLRTFREGLHARQLFINILNVLIPAKITYLYQRFIISKDLNVSENQLLR
jgi:hypothetical protein